MQEIAQRHARQRRREVIRQRNDVRVRQRFAREQVYVLYHSFSNIDTVIMQT